MKPKFFTNETIKKAIAYRLLNKIKRSKQAGAGATFVPMAVSTANKGAGDLANNVKNVGAATKYLGQNTFQDIIRERVTNGDLWVDKTPYGRLNYIAAGTALPANVLTTISGAKKTYDAAKRIYNGDPRSNDYMDAWVDLGIGGASTVGGATSTASNIASLALPGTVAAETLAAPAFAWIGPAAGTFALAYGKTRELDKAYGHDVAEAYQRLKNRQRHGKALDGHTDPALDAWDIFSTGINYPVSSARGIIGGGTYDKMIRPYIQDKKEEYIGAVKENLKKRGFSDLDIRNAIGYAEEEFDKAVSYDPAEYARFMFDADNNNTVSATATPQNAPLKGNPTPRLAMADYIADKLKRIDPAALATNAHRQYETNEIAKRWYTAENFMDRFNSAARNTAILTMDPSTKRSLMRAGVDVRRMIEDAYREDLQNKKKLAAMGIYVDTKQPIPAQLYLDGVVDNPTREGAQQTIKKLKEEWKRNHSQDIAKAWEAVSNTMTQPSGEAVEEALRINKTPYEVPVELGTPYSTGSNTLYSFNRFKEDNEGAGLKDYLVGTNLDKDLKEINNPELAQYTGTFGKLNDSMDAVVDPDALYNTGMYAYMPAHQHITQTVDSNILNTSNRKTRQLPWIQDY